MSEEPTRSRAGTTEDGARRDRERPPLPEPLPHPVVDNHCHLDIADGDVAGRTDEAIAAAAEVGVTRIVQIGCDLPGRGGRSRRRRRTTPWSPASRCTPTRRRGWPRPGELDEALDEIERLAQAHDKVRAVGETGLDCYRTGPEGRAAQVESFRRHIDLAKRLDKTLVIHDRDAHDEVLRGHRRRGRPRPLGDALLLRRRRPSPGRAWTAAPTCRSPAR